MTFHELMKRPHHTQEEELLIQAIALISVMPKFDHMTPEEVFEHIKAKARETQIAIAAMGRHNERFKEPPDVGS